MSYAMFNKYHAANPIDLNGNLVISEEYLNERKKLLDERGAPPSPESSVTNYLKIERMLKCISADCDYKTYREIIWSLESLNWLHSFEIQIMWSRSAPHRFELRTLINLIKSYKPGHFSYGTLSMHAKQNGWDEGAWQDEQRQHDIEHAWGKKLSPSERTKLLLLKWGGDQDKNKYSQLKAELKSRYQRSAALELTSNQVDIYSDKNHSKFNPLSISQLENAPKQPSIIKGLIASRGISAIYGPSGSGKSFAIIDLMCHITTQSAWYGHKINPCPVIYVALEGIGGVAKRFKAWEKHHKIKIPDTLKIVTEHLSLLNPEDSKNLANRLIEMRMGTGLIVIDTLNQSAPEADENVSKDMGRIISNAQLLQKLTGSHVMLVHHSGKDTTKGLRGHSSLLAALDLAIQVNKSGDKRSWHVAKNKDDIDGKTYFFKLEQINLGSDEDGEPINSCVTLPDIQPVIQAKKPKPKGAQQAIALMVITRLIQNGTKNSNQPSGRIKVSDAIKEVGDSLLVDDKRRGERAKTAINGLLALNLLTQEGDLLSLP